MNGITSAGWMIGQINDTLGLLNDGAYSKPLKLLHGSTIGQHVRHILNFYETLAGGCSDELVDYGNRNRDVRLESEIEYAYQKGNDMMTNIMTLNENNRVLVRVDFSSDPAEDRPVVQSTIGRELMYAFDHAVHHLAIIRIGLTECMPDLELDKDFGKAPSTVKFEAGTQ